MKIKLPHPQTMSCWRCGATPAVTSREWKLYLLNHHKRKFNDHVLGQITTIDMPLCARCEENMRKSNRVSWVSALVTFAVGYLLFIILVLVGVLDLTMAEALKVGVVCAFIPALIVWAFYKKSIQRKATGFHPDFLRGHPVFGFFHDHGWTDNVNGTKSKYSPKVEEEYRVDYVSYLQWLQTAFGYRITDDSGNTVDLTTPEFAGAITPELARRVSISFTTDTNFQTHNVRNLRQSHMN